MIAADTTQVEPAHSEKPARASVSPWRTSGWMIFSVVAILLATVALGIGVFLACAGIFGLNEVRLAIGQVGHYPVKVMASAPAQVQNLFFILLSVLFACMAVPCVGAAMIAGRGAWRERLALSRFAETPAALWVVVLLLAMPVYLIGASLTIKFIEPAFTTWFFVPRQPSGLALSFLAVVIMAPLAEELLFRGWIMTGLLKSFRPSTSIIVTTLLFAFAHSDGTMLYPVAIFIPGLMLALVRYWTGSVWASFGAHAAYNAWAWGLVLILGKDLV